MMLNFTNGYMPPWLLAQLHSILLPITTHQPFSAPHVGNPDGSHDRVRQCVDYHYRESQQYYQGTHTCIMCLSMLCPKSLHGDRQSVHPPTQPAGPP